MYAFCNYLDQYISTNVWLSDELISTEYAYYCTFDIDDPFRRSNLESLCVKFKKLYNIIFDIFDEYSSMKNENGEYLNYWLNNELKNKHISNISSLDFYQKLINNDSSFDTEQKLKYKIHDIKEEHLKQMDILYELNTIYNNIKITPYNDKRKCIDYSNECEQKFRRAIESCSTVNNDKYCTALNSFKKKYEEFNGDETFSGCKKEYLSTLPSLGNENKPNVIVNLPAADKSKVEPHAEEIKDQNLRDQPNIVEERQASPYTIQPSFSSTEENNYDKKISIYSIFGIILSISVFSIITYKVKYITYKNNNI
ncbi:hypothetical protein PVMG_05356 [Plasmodium vivax Mauritania I]|uniref:Uncharacterized protein n=1 Tax=Plasmodium vivax Mauritania I TaxID=1035515 RepID=A0A0J9TLZ4_PLAVI|nr:hypothetical protein PVMG_05356 [Plasmodium vivax Mauritania I]